MTAESAVTSTPPSTVPSNPVGAAVAVPPGLARSWLLVPGSVDDLAARVAASVADVVVVDLEDGVAPDDKGAARRALVALADAGERPWVRIGDAASDEWRTDVALLRGAELVAGVVHHGDLLLSQAEPSGHADGCRVPRRLREHGCIA